MIVSSSSERAPGRWHRFRAARVAVAIGVTAPLVLSAVYMWAAWDPTTKVPDLPVALVNSDVPAGDGPSRIAAGTGVTANLLKSRALDFHEVDRNSAMNGLRSGKYYFVIEIPADFSSTLSSIGDTATAPALIDVSYNDNNTLMASNIGARAMSAMSAAVLRGVATSTVGKVLDGVDSLGQGLTDAADGAARLRAGTDKVARGADRLATSMAGSLAPGVSQATDGSRRLSTGADELAKGALELQQGTNRLGSGADQLADGIERLTTVVPTGTLLAELDRLTALAARGGVSVSAVAKVRELLSGLEKLQSGSRELANQLTEPTAPYRRGVDQLADGSDRLRTGAQQLATGMEKVDAGARRAAAGADEISAGAERVDAGASTLATGLSDGAGDLPELGDKAAKTNLAQLLSTPVSTRSTNLADAQFSGPGAAPFLLAVMSLLVPILVCMCFRSTRVAQSRRMSGPHPFLRRMAAVVTTNVFVMSAVAVGIWMMLSPAPDPASLAQVTLVVATATAMNVTIVGLVYTLLGFVTGTITTLTFLMFQLFAFGGVWMVETVPTPFRWLHPWAPMSYTRDGLIAAFNGAPGLTTAVTVMVAITLVGAAINVALNTTAIRPSRLVRARLATGAVT